jgi:nitroimidazol reductase NimA-like FMN-containing flavoprotein (pyridoxamine 5'-phosphate oxidase superfamily)
VTETPANRIGAWHIRRIEREIKDENELRSILKNGRYATIGLSKEDEPYVVTLSYGYDPSENALFFHCAKEGQKMDFLRSNPRVCATIIEDDGFDSGSCDHAYRSVVLRGTMHIINDRIEIDRGIRLMIEQQDKKNAAHFYEKLKPGNKSYDNLQLLKMTVDSMTGKAR